MHINNVIIISTLTFATAVNAQEQSSPVRVGIINAYEEDEDGIRINDPDGIISQINAVRPPNSPVFYFSEEVIFVNPQKRFALRDLAGDIRNAIKHGRQVVIIPLLRGENKDPVLKDIIYGTFDAFLKEIAHVIKPYTDKGHVVRVRHLHEGDGSWYTWAVYYKRYSAGEVLNTKEDYIRAWNHIRDLLWRETRTDNLRFQFSLNRRPAQGKVSFEHISSYFPGKNVHEIVVASYNRCKIDYTDQRTFAQEFRPIYEALLPFGIPIGIAETSTTDLCSYAGHWFQELFDDLIFSFPKVTSVDFFLNYAEETDVPWGLKNDSQRLSFYKGWAKLGEQRGITPLNQPDSVMRFPVDEFTYPWTLRSEVMYHDGTYNDALNPVRNEPFGDRGFVTSLYAEQGLVHDAPFGGTLGVYASGFVSNSDNPNYWWDNLVEGKVEMRYCHKAELIADWGTLCALIGNKQTHYTKDVPERLKGITPETFVGLKLNVGGEW